VCVCVCAGVGVGVCVCVCVCVVCCADMPKPDPSKSVYSEITWIIIEVPIITGNAQRGQRGVLLVCYVMVPLLPPVNCVEDSWGWRLHAEGS
jgi:hypothetical protein